MSAALTRTRVATHKQTFARGLVSEWIKLRSVKSTWIGAGAFGVVLVGFAALGALLTSSAAGAGPQMTDPLSTVLMGANLAVLVLGALGALAGAREFGSRMITTTTVAVPRRWKVVVAKATVLTAVILPVSLIGVFGAYALGMPILGAHGATTVALTDPGVLTSLVGMAGYLTAIALIGFGLGMLFRGTTGAIAGIIGGVLILPMLLGSLLPDSWDVVLQFLPTSAASAFTVVAGSGGMVLSAAAGVVVLVGWVLAAVGGAGVSYVRRDV
jgi:hypothetical protein